MVLIEQHGLRKTLEKTLPSILADEGTDGLIVILAGFKYTLEVIRDDLMKRISDRYQKPIIICVLVGYKEYKDLIFEELGSDFPIFTSLKSGVISLSKACDYGMHIRHHE